MITLDAWSHSREGLSKDMYEIILHEMYIEVKKWTLQIK